MHRCAAALLAVAALHAQAQPAVYRIDAENTRVHFEVMHFGTSTLRARFDRLAGSIVLDRGAQRGELSISIDTGSVSSGTLPFDGMLRGANLLDATAFPQAWFVAQRFVFDGDRLAGVDGEFTLHGTSRPLGLRALRFRCAPHPTLQRELCGGDFEAELRRSDYGITYGLPFVADRVRLVIQVEALRD